jgi:hypothetical protein
MSRHLCGRKGLALAPDGHGCIFNSSASIFGLSADSAWISAQGNDSGVSKVLTDAKKQIGPGMVRPLGRPGQTGVMRPG